MTADLYARPRVEALAHSLPPIPLSLVCVGRT